MSKYKIDTRHLRNVKNYATLVNVAPTYIYRLIRDQVLSAVIIDEIPFVDITQYPELPSRKDLPKTK